MPTPTDIAVAQVAGSTDPRGELLRSLGAVALTPPPGNAVLCQALDLPVQTGVEHTDVFVLSAPPHAAIHLGAEGKLGGEGLDRIAGFWRALGLTAPEDADHLGTLLMLYAELTEAERLASDERRGAQMHRARTALFHEHIWSWAPGYLAAVAGLGVPSTSAWAQLTEQVLRAEHAELGAPESLPLAMRTAPPGLDLSDSFDDTLDGLVAPIRSGSVLTYRDLTACGSIVGVGVRRGERRYALRAMLEQDAPATLGWLAGHARSWSQQHASAAISENDPGAWWSARAAHTAGVLEAMASDGMTVGPRTTTDDEGTYR